MRQPITIKDHGEITPDCQWVRFTIYLGQFPKREVVCYTNDAGYADMIAVALAHGGVITRTFGKPDQD